MRDRVLFLRDGFRKDAHDRGQDPEADPDVSCKSGRDSGHHIYQICSSGDEEPLFFSDEGDSPCCHLRNISWNLLWDFKVGISVRTGEYSVRGRKTADAASDRQQKRD